MAVRRPAAKTAERASVRPRSPLEWGGAGGGRGGRDPRARGAWSTRARSRFAGDSFRTRAASRGRARSRWRVEVAPRNPRTGVSRSVGRAYLEGILETVGDVTLAGESLDGADGLDGLRARLGWEGQRPPRRARDGGGARGDARIRAETGRGRRNRSHQALVRGRTLATEAERAATLRAETRATGAATRRADTVTAAILRESERVQF